MDTEGRGLVKNRREFESLSSSFSSSTSDLRFDLDGDDENGDEDEPMVRLALKLFTHDSLR